MNILAIVNKYLNLLRQMPSDADYPVQYAEELMVKYDEELRALGATELALELFLNFNYLYFLAEYQESDLHNREDIGEILSQHLRVENHLRKYLIHYLPLGRLKNDVSKITPIPFYVDLMRQKNRNEYIATFVDGLEQVEAIRSKLSNDPTYELCGHDTVSMVEHMQKFQPERLPQNIVDPLACYKAFCHYACDHFRAQTWGLSEIRRKIDKIPPAPTDWVKFAQRFAYKP